MTKRLPLKVPEGGLFGLNNLNINTTNDNKAKDSGNNVSTSNISDKDDVTNNVSSINSTITKTKSNTTNKSKKKANTKNSTSVSTINDAINSTENINNNKTSIKDDVETVATNNNTINVNTQYTINIPKNLKYTDTRKQRSYYVKFDNLDKMDELVANYNFDKSDIVNQALELFFQAFDEYISQMKKK